MQEKLSPLDNRCSFPYAVALLMGKRNQSEEKKKKPTELDRVVGLNVQRLREARNESQTSAGAAIGIGQPYLSGLEAGKKVWMTHHMHNLCKHWGVEYYELVLSPEQSQFMKYFRSLKAEEAEMFKKMLAGAAGG